MAYKIGQTTIKVCGGGVKGGFIKNSYQFMFCMLLLCRCSLLSVNPAFRTDFATKGDNLSGSFKRSNEKRLIFRTFPFIFKALLHF